MKGSVLCFVLSAGALLGWCAQANAMAPLWTPAGDDCSASHFHVNDLASYAEEKEQRLAAASTESVNPGTNGSIRIHGWNQSGVLVKACVQTAAPSESEARSIASQISLAQGPGQIEPNGPSMNDQLSWSVSYEIWVPAASNLHLEANNGSIHIESVQGQIRFHTQNGSVHLAEVGGDVDGSTTNGSLHIDLAGSAWNGSGLRAETTNGSVEMTLPENYSARVETSTVNGRIKIDFPITVSGEIGKEMSFQLGSGGPTVQAKTVNGSVRILRKG
jgi:Putative adhesin